MPYLPVGEGHTIYYEEHGNPAGRPVVVLHGGPGGGLQRSMLGLFDLGRWHVILYDQRGCGRSTPRGSKGLRANTTRHLVADLEKLRVAVDITDGWTVFGGSWGSTLALAYASKYTKAVTGLILRGIFLGEPWETAWMYAEGGASRIYPLEWEKFRTGGVGGKKSATNLTRAYRRRLLSKNRQTRRAAARAWWDWEHKLSFIENPHNDHTPIANIEDLAILENHYFSHNCWLKPGELLRAARRLCKAPVTIVQGELDLVCPAEAAVALHAAMPHSRLVLVPGAGHAASEPSIAKALRDAIERMHA